MKVYLAGPISSTVTNERRTLTVEEKIARFHLVSNVLEKDGHEVVNPILVGNTLCIAEEGSPPPCINENEIANGQGEHSWKCYMRHDIVALLECDSIAMLPQWEFSRGALLEYHIAKELGYNILLVGIKHTTMNNTEQFYVRKANR